MTEFAFVDGLRAFADRYEGFVLDQWGVLHDGAAPYPGVLDALMELKRRGKRVVLLSNSGRRRAHSEAHLRSIGFQPGLFDGIVTSGETAWRLLAERSDPEFEALGRSCVLVTRDEDREVVLGTGVAIVEDVRDADFVLLAGVDSPRLGMEDYRGLIEAAAGRGLTVVCSNPDLFAPTGDGLVLAPGSLAALHAELGGRVLYVGKPYAPVYRACRALLDELELGEIVAVGDSLEHDIKGANCAGFASAFVLGGLHAADFPEEAGATHHDAALVRLAGEIGATPDWVIPTFAW